MDKKSILLRSGLAVVIFSVLMIMKSLDPLFGGIAIAIVVAVSVIRLIIIKKKEEEADKL